MLSEETATSAESMGSHGQRDEGPNSAAPAPGARAMGRCNQCEAAWSGLLLGLVFWWCRRSHLST